MRVQEINDFFISIHSFLQHLVSNKHCRIEEFIKDEMESLFSRNKEEYK